VIVANLETVISEPSSELRPKAYSVSLGTDAYRRISGSGVAAFNLANNHVYDAGAAVFDEMRGRLECIPGIQFYGLRDRPFAVLHAAGLSCAVIGCLEPCRARGPALFPEEEVESLVVRLCREHAKVYVTPHWGLEGEFAFHPGPHQRALARRWIEAGASGIFGHHPHTFHGRELMSGKPVCYSVGNYQFDHAEGRRYPSAAWGMVVRVDPGAGDACDSAEFFLQVGGNVIPADREADALMREHLARLSSELPVVSADSWRWARTVGPVYLAKCARSWRLRMKSSPVRTAGIWAVWNLMPRTLLFRLGNLAEDRSAAAYRAQLDAQLLAAQRRLSGSAE
jgi:poly-gamma-glutamate synthesis protein (capsule biosynthesis protein)